MADKKDTRSSFRDALTAAPAGIGLSYALRDAMKGRSAATTAVTSKQTITTMRSVATGSAETDLGFLADKLDYFSTPRGTETLKLAWKEAVESTNPLAKEILDFTTAGNQSPSQMVSAIKQTLTRNKSLFMSRTFLKFRRNLEALSQQTNLPKFVPASAAVPPPMNLAVNELPKELGGFYNRVLKAGNITGTGVSLFSRPGWEEAGFGTYLFNFRYKGTPFQVMAPYSKGGVLVEGLSQSSRRIAPSVKIFDPASKTFVSTMSRHEFFLSDFEKSVLPLITSGKYQSKYQIQKAVDELYKQDIYALESTPNIPLQYQNVMQRNYENIKGQAVDIRVLDQMAEAKPNELFRSVYRSPNEFEFTAAMRADSALMPSSSPSNLAEGRVSLHDPRSWYMTPNAVSMSRRPSQALRTWRATPAAVQEMFNSGSCRRSIFETQAWRQDMGAYIAPHLPTLYVDPAKHVAMLEQLGMGEGESLVAGTSSIRKQLEVYRVADPIHMSKIAENLEQRIASSSSFEVGEILGWTPEGSPVTYKPGMDLMGLESFATTGRGEYTSLYFREIYRPHEAEKRFNQYKAMERFTDQFKMQRTIARATHNNLFIANTMRIVSMDELRKDPAKHATQMITGLHEILSGRQESFVSHSPKIASFLRSPTTFASYLEGKATQGGIYSHEAFTRNLIGFAAKEGRLTSQEFGAVFGAVPSVFGETVAKSLIPNEDFYKAASEGFTIGDTQSIFSKSLDAGGLGSVEPRAFTLLGAGQYGKLGQDISEDFARRLAVSNPETLQTYEGLTKTLESISGKVSSPTGTAIWKATQEYTQEGFQEFLEKGGGWLKTGSGVNDIFVPGAKELGLMSPYMTAGKQVIAGEIAHEYHNLARSLSQNYMANKRLDLQYVNEVLGNFIKNIHAYQAPAGNSMGAIERGKLLGSRFLKGVSEAAGQKTVDPFTVGIPEFQASSMFEEMRATGLYDESAVSEMEKRFIKGEAIGGVVARHPFIGQYSVQPAQFQILRGVSDPVITMPHFNVDIRLAGQTKSNPISLSPMVGFAGDLDADIYAAYLTSPDTEKAIRQDFVHASNEYTQQYIEHSIRAQLIKAKAAPGGAALTIRDLMIADAKKLATAQSWVGKLSVQLSTARTVVTRSSLTQQRKANAMFLLEWLEQVPISGKHLDPERVLNNEMSELFKTVLSALETRSSVRLQDAISGILKNSDETTRNLLTQDISIEEGAESIRKITGVQSFRNKISGINLPESIEDVMSLLGSAKESGLEDELRLRTGRKALTMPMLESYLAAGREGGKFSAVASMSNMIGNLKTRIGQSFIKNKKAVGFGFLGSLAIGAMLASPRETIGPGVGIDDVSVNTHPGKAINRMTPETIVPPQQSVGQPTIPDISSSPRTMISPNKVGNSIRVRARGNYSNIQELNSNLGENSININIRDSSSIIDATKVLGKIL